MTLQLITNDKEPTKPEEPKGKEYKLIYEDGEGQLTTKQVSGFPVLFGHYLAISADRDGLMLPVLAVPHEAVISLEIVE